MFRVRGIGKKRAICLPPEQGRQLLHGMGRLMFLVDLPMEELRMKGSSEIIPMYTIRHLVLGLKRNLCQLLVRELQQQL